VLATFAEKKCPPTKGCSAIGPEPVPFYMFKACRSEVFGALLNIIAIIGHGSVDNDTEYIVQQFIMRWLTVILVQKSDVTSSRVNRMWKAIATHGCRGGLRELSKRSPWNGQESVF